LAAGSYDPSATRYDTVREIIMNLTEEQAKAAAAEPEGVRLKDPGTNREYVLVRADVFDRLRQLQYDDSSWTSEEREAFAWETGKHAGWAEMDEYDNYPETP
jgi:hypothetical protein